MTAEDYTFVYLPRAPAAVWGLSGFTGAIYVTTVVALLAVIVACCRAPRAQGAPLALFVVAAMALNAVICGILSGPHPRYQARVIWLLPLLAAGLLLGSAPAVSRSREAPAPRAP